MVATGTEYFTGPAWIAGGNELLYATRDRNPLRRVPIKGGPARILPGIDVQTEIISLAPAGAGEVAAEIWKHDGALWQLDLRAQTPHFEKLRRIPHTDGGHRVSADGRRVVFVSSGGLWTSDLDGGNARLIAKEWDRAHVLLLPARHAESIPNPRWSPDGRWIAFAGFPAEGNADNRARLYLVQADGGTPQRLLPNRDDVTFTNWSRDGKWLYVSRHDLDLLSSANPRLWKVRIASEELVQVTKSGGESAAEESVGPDWLYYNWPSQKLRRVPISSGTESRLLDENLENGDLFAVGRESVYFVPEGPNS